MGKSNKSTVSEEKKRGAVSVLVAAGQGALLRAVKTQREKDRTQEVKERGHEARRPGGLQDPGPMAGFRTHRERAETIAAYSGIYRLRQETREPASQLQHPRSQAQTRTPSAHRTGSRGEQQAQERAHSVTSMLERSTSEPLMYPDPGAPRGRIGGAIRSRPGMLSRGVYAQAEGGGKGAKSYGKQDSSPGLLQTVKLHNEGPEKLILTHDPLGLVGGMRGLYVSRPSDRSRPLIHQ
mmetsp:Transcript_29479/g.46254  ORF Transcript_29479/g.46254 Transcript_29479/m.46254 type:complete len:237 (+) Transcript_29479:443-1153(+)